MSGLLEMLRAMDDHEDEKPESQRPLTEAQVMTLREIYAAYAAGCCFKAGDLVTPKRGFNLHGEGAPHIVLELAPVPIRNFSAETPRETCSNVFGRRMDVRVACFARNGQYDSFWMESWTLEPYVGPAGTAAQ